MRRHSNHLPYHVHAGQNIRGRYFSQESLQPEMPGVIAGSPVLIKALLLIVVAVLCSLSGIVAGFFGSNFFFNISLTNTPERIEILWMIFIVIAWLITTLRQGISKGLRMGLITFVVTLVLTILLAQFNFLSPIPKETEDAPELSPVIDHIIQHFSTSIIGIFTAITSLVLGGVSISLNQVLSNNKSLSRNIIAVSIIAIATITTISSYSGGWLYNKPTENSLIIIIITMGGGIISGLIVGIISLITTQLSYQNGSDFEFFRSWAIAASTWGSTSFYNLDLSGVDFTGAQLANTDLRAQKLYRTCLQGVAGLDRARVDNRYLDLTNPKVQKLLTCGCSEGKDFSRINLQGAYLREADMRNFKLVETNLNGSDLQGADLRNSILVRAQVTGVNFTSANLTGICIEDWSVNTQTCFARVECEYIYRKLDDTGEPTERYPIDRNFEPGEFESLFQEVENVVELVFKEGVNWRALSFTFRKFQLEDEGLGLELKGVEQRGDLWVVKVTHKEGIPRQEVEQRVSTIYDDLKSLMAIKEQQINKLLGIAADQAEALKGYSKQPFGNSFFIFGSTITNLAGSGQIDYDEAASKIRSIVANGGDLPQVTPVAQKLLAQFENQSVANTSEKQAELIQQIILTEAKRDPFFKQFFVQQGQQIADAMPESAIATAIREAYSQIT